MAKARRFGMAARSSSAVMEGADILVAPVRLQYGSGQGSFRRTRAAMGAASRDLAHDILDLRRCWFVQHVLITGVQLRPDARDTCGAGGRRRDGPDVRL